MGKYAGNMPGGGNSNPARPPYRGNATSYNLAIGTNRLVRELPEGPRLILQTEVRNQRQQGVKEEDIRTFVEQTVHFYRQGTV